MFEEHLEELICETCLPLISQNAPIGIVSLHDVLRFQHQLSEAASL
jgi:hypothetical protein